jgi:hypothetical protein
MDAFAVPAFPIDPEKVRDISGEVLGSDGRLMILPASYWAGTTRVERALFGHRHGIYSFPTVELVAYLQTVIGDRRAIEIGAGHGVLAEALQIPGTDSFQHAEPEYRARIEAFGQPVVQYGPKVERLDALRAVSKYRPEVVIGCWVTHKFNRRRSFAGGNEVGIAEEKILKKVATYVVVGNEFVHKDKVIWDQPHQIGFPDWIYSRAQNGSRDFIAEWNQ